MSKLENILRAIENIIQERFQNYKVLAFLGVRQSGKSTLMPELLMFWIKMLTKRGLRVIFSSCRQRIKLKENVICLPLEYI